MIGCGGLVNQPIENVIMNVFRNGFLARKLMMVAIMAAVVVNTINSATSMTRSFPNSVSTIVGIFLKLSKDNNVKIIGNVMIYVLRNRFLK